MSVFAEEKIYYFKGKGQVNTKKKQSFFLDRLFS